MQRKEFLQKTALLSLGLSCTSLGFGRIRKWYEGGHNTAADVSDGLQSGINGLIAWLRSAGWAAYLKKELGADLTLTGDALRHELTRKLDPHKLAALRSNPRWGYDDFAGERLIQPGFPAFSLLFHMLASPRVRPAGVTEYPALAQIDLLEDFVYAICDWSSLKQVHDVKSGSDLVLAVFAYEYRTAFKTPHHLHADMVYSRTGFGRIGQEPPHYDAENRCFINRPASQDKERIAAVTPARYGLFIAKKVRNTDIALVKEELHKGDDCKDDRNNDHETFLQPIRKVFNNDLLTGERQLEFTEYHVTEKLEKFAKMKGVKMWKDRMPQKRFSDTLIVQDDSQRFAGSSFLIISQPAPLIRKAREGGVPLFFWVNRHLRPGDKGYPGYDNRFFTALCTQKVEDVELLQGYEHLTRGANPYLTPRNQPMFINITNRQTGDDTTYEIIPKAPDESFEDTVNDGEYFAPLFEDSICDGRVSVNTGSFPLDRLEGMSTECLPAFSVVTAPDFFPQIDPMDLEAFDVEPGPSRDSNFFEGGVASLATARIRPNPKVLDTARDTTRDTYLAVLSGAARKDMHEPPERLKAYKDPAADRGYEVSGYLPDVASSVFAPGWDVTYCSLSRYSTPDDIYVGTEGLGSPFIEDMKFCSALNGMWPATSPDAARTYQGAGETRFRNPTSVPLLDKEIGISGAGPGRGNECTGWDGEQGPYLERKGGLWKINFTDLGRADAVTNALRGLVDMRLLRRLTAAELIARMECLRLCIQALPKKNFHEALYKPKVTAYTYLWLVSAEKVHWGSENAAALGIPDTLVGNDRNWIADRKNARVRGEGYLYLFANSAADEQEADPSKHKDWTDDLKRRRLDCHEIYVCQVTSKPERGSHKIAWTEIKDGAADWQLA